MTIDKEYKKTQNWQNNLENLSIFATNIMVIGAGAGALGVLGNNGVEWDSVFRSIV